MSPRSAHRIRTGILAARADMRGQWERPAVWGRVGFRAYGREISRHATPGERYKLAEMRILARKG